MTQDPYKTLIEPPDNGDLSNPGQSITQKTNSAKSQISSSQSLIKKTQSYSPSYFQILKRSYTQTHTNRQIQTQKSFTKTNFRLSNSGPYTLIPSRTHKSNTRNQYLKDKNKKKNNKRKVFFLKCQKPRSRIGRSDL